MTTQYEQFTLNFPQTQKTQFKDFLTGKNKELIEHLRAPVSDTERLNTYICGSDGTGKTHLLQASCAHARDNNQSAIYICLENKDEYEPELLDGMEVLSLICIDDIENIIGDRRWEEAIFHLYNRCSETNTRIIFSSKEIAANLLLTLPDLKARIQTMLVFKVFMLNESERIMVLKQNALARGFELPDDVIKHLITRYPRDFHSLFNVLKLIDRKSLEAGKKVSLNFVRKMLDGD